MRKTTSKLKKFEQFDPEVVQTEASIDTKRLQKLINMTSPLLDEISNIIEQDADRTISIEYFNRISSAIDALDELKNMY